MSTSLEGLTGARITLDARHPEAARVGGDPHLLHGFTMRLVDSTRASEANLLWRADNSNRMIVLAVQANGPLRLEEVQALPWVNQVQGPLALGARLGPALTPGSTWRLQARVNPCRSGRRRIAVTADADIASWFTERTGDAFTVAEDPMWGGPDLAITHEGGVVSASRGFTINSATVRATVTVTDAERTAHLIRHGLGRERAFGFGLLQMVPVAP